jgi:DNA-binding MarR family transcriptional regulator
MGTDGHEPFSGVAFNLSSLGYAVSRGFQAILVPFQLHPREFAVLRTVGAEEGQTQQALADRLQIPRSRMVAIVDELEGRALVERRPNQADRRVRELYVSAAGRKLLDRAFEQVLEYEGQIGASLSPAEREQLLKLLGRISTDLGIGKGAHTALREDGEH